jgi:tryptophan synthase alpha chain
MHKILIQQHSKAFIPFIMAGHPTLNTTQQAVLALAAAGADLIELGVPFSDPVADGPINQKAAEIALEQGVNLTMILEMVQSIRQQGCQTPIILFSYLNPILAFGVEAFAARAKQSGVDGVLIVDLPPEEGEAYYALLKNHGLGVVLLVSPTTNPERFELYRRVNPAFIYYISRLSVTGVQEALAPQLSEEIQALRAYFPQHPIVVGFGISNAIQARTVSTLADGVVVGSVLVKTLGADGVDALQLLALQLAQAIHGVDG